jgi:hypothetical protein
MAGRLRRDATGATTPRRHEAGPAARLAPWTAVNRRMGAVFEFQNGRDREYSSSGVRILELEICGIEWERGGDDASTVKVGGQSVDPGVNAIPSGGWVGWAEGRGRTRSRSRKERRKAQPPAGDHRDPLGSIDCHHRPRT